MVIVQARSKRKATGGRYKKQIILKRKYELGRSPSLIKLETSKKKVIRTKGGGSKIRLMSANILNIVGSDGKFKKTKIISVIENSANKNFVRRNIMTKGAIVETEAGKAKITKRPGQDGILNGVLI